MPKTLLRQRLRQQRRQLTTQQQQRAAQHLAQRLAQLPWLAQKQHIGIYYPSDGEISPLTFVAQQPTKQFYLPSLCTTQQRTLRFHPWGLNDTIVYNALNVAEPVAQSEVKPTLTLDILLLPLVGFDAQGGRLGMGGGFYDYSLRHAAQASTRPRLVGIAHACQEVENLPTEPWDVPLDAVVTDQKTFIF